MEKKILFIDETGDHDLIHIDKNYPILGLLGVIFDNDYYMSVATKELNHLKSSFSIKQETILHTLEIVRSMNDFDFCKDPIKRTRFYEAIDDFLCKLDYTVIFGVIDKIEYTHTYAHPFDTYGLILDFVEERLYFYLKDLSYKGINAEGEIIAESRDEKLDSLVEDEHNKILIIGTDYIKPSDIKARIKNFTIRDKKDNITGLQVADLIASQLGRDHLGLRMYWGSNIKNKIRKAPDGNIVGYGLIVFPPQKDLG